MSLPDDQLLHLALVYISIAVSCKDSLEGLVGVATLPIFYHFANIDILNRVVVRGE